MIRIPDSELMAEKLGMVVLCQSCGERLRQRHVMRIPIWEHEKTSSIWCDDSKKGEFRAVARKGPLADELRAGQFPMIATTVDKSKIKS